MRGTRSRDVPVIFAFSEIVAERVKDASCPVLVLPANGWQDLRLSEPPILQDDECDLEEPDDDARDWNRYPWQVALHVTKLSWLLRDTKRLQEVITQSTAVLRGPEEAYDAEERIQGHVPHQTAIGAWQVRMDLMNLLY